MTVQDGPKAKVSVHVSSLKDQPTLEAFTVRRQSFFPPLD